MSALPSIPGLPQQACHRLLDVLQRSTKVQEIWLFGSRAMERYRTGSDLDLCLVGEAITHLDRLQLMHAIDEQLLPGRWTWPSAMSSRRSSLITSTALDAASGAGLSLSKPHSPFLRSGWSRWRR